MKVSSKGIKFAKSLQKICKDCQRCCFNLIATVEREGQLSGKATIRHLVLISFCRCSGSEDGLSSWSAFTLYLSLCGCPRRNDHSFSERLGLWLRVNFPKSFDAHYTATIIRLADIDVS